MGRCNFSDEKNSIPLLRIYQHLIYYRITISERQSIHVIMHVFKFSKIPIEMDISPVHTVI